MILCLREGSYLALVIVIIWSAPRVVYGRLRVVKHGAGCVPDFEMVRQVPSLEDMPQKMRSE